MNEDDEIALERLVRPDCISDHDDVQLTADSTHQHHHQQQHQQPVTSVMDVRDGSGRVNWSVPQI